MLPLDFELSGQVVDIQGRRTYPARVVVSSGNIAEIEPLAHAPDVFILPGFVDAHVHIESSLLTPCQFARMAVVHGIVATVSDPHEIANVLGVAGVRYMIENGAKVPFRFYFGAPSCVPATGFETAGAEISVADVEMLLQWSEIKYLAEMMNWPGVLHRDPDVLAKIAAAQKLNKPIDGHAPGLRGEQARQYAAAGMTTDHECFTREEALDKLAVGMKILIREGSAAKNFEALIDLLPDFPQQIMFCSDDKHPDSLVVGHINELVRRAVARGYDVFDALQAACVNPVVHYGLETGLLRPGDAADFIVVNNLKDFRVLQTYIGGQLVAENGQTRIPSLDSEVVNQFNASLKTPEQFAYKSEDKDLWVIEAIDGQLVTNKKIVALENAKPHPKSLSYREGLQIRDPEAPSQQGASNASLGSQPVRQGLGMRFFNETFLQSDVAQDILKITVVNRYADAPPAVAFIKNFGLKTGAIASSVAHDSHNIIAVGVDDEAICRAVNLVIEAKGGLSAVNGDVEKILPLPIAGLMTGADGYEVAKQYEELDQFAKQQLGSTLQSPYMTLSFMALLVIPRLKLSDRGLFDGENFRFV